MVIYLGNEQLRAEQHSDYPAGGVDGLPLREKIEKHAESPMQKVTRVFTESGDVGYALSRRPPESGVVPIEQAVKERLEEVAGLGVGGERTEDLKSRSQF